MALHQFISWRYFKARKGFLSVVSTFSLSGIILGVAALIVVMSVMAGFRSELMSRILGISGHATITKQEFSYDQVLEVQKRMTEIDDVSSAEPFVQGQSMLVIGGRAAGVMMRGIAVKEGEDIILGSIVSGSVADLEKPNHIAIGASLAKKNGLGVGSVVTLMSPQGNQTVVGFIPRMKKFKVAALFDVGMYLYDNSWVYTSIANAQMFYGLGENVTGLDIRVHHPESIESLRSEFFAKAGPMAFVATWEDANRQFFQALEVERVAMFIILSLVVVIAAFNIITGQMMTVNEKRGDIAILRTMGARRRDILQIFMLNGCFIGLIGTILGVGSGLLVVHYLDPIVTLIEDIFGVSIFRGENYFLSELPALIIWQDVMAVACMSLALSMMASLAPAYRAAKTDPVEVLRSE